MIQHERGFESRLTYYHTSQQLTEHILSCERGFESRLTFLSHDQITIKEQSFLNYPDSTNLLLYQQETWLAKQGL